MTEWKTRPTSDIAMDFSVAITPHQSGRHLIRATGPDEPFFYLGDTAWELFHRLDDAEAEWFIKNRKDKGFNAIMVVLMAEHGGLDYPNREGAFPFLPSSESTPEKYIPDISKPNPAYFTFVDRVSRICALHGVTLVLVPTWGRYVNGGYYGEASPILFDEENAYEYCKLLGERYPFHPWVLGGDSNRYWNRKTMDVLRPGGDPNSVEVVDFGAVTEAMAKGLLEGEKNALARVSKEIPGAKEYTPFITFHSAQVWLPSTPETSASAQFPNSKWLSLDCVQTGHHDSQRGKSDTDDDAQAGGGGMPMWYARSSYIPVRNMYKAVGPDGRPRPVMDLEAHYENTHHWFTYDKPLWTAADIRRGGWQAIFAGCVFLPRPVNLARYTDDRACGYTYGCNSIWQMHNAESKTHPPIAPPTTAYTNWYHEVDLPGAYQAGIMRNIMLSLPAYHSRVPDQSIIVSDTNEPKDGKWAGDKLISGMRGNGWAMVHLPHGGSVELDLEKAVPGKGEYRVWWIDPRTGGRESEGKGKVAGKATGTAKFTAPEGDEDWLLLIETVSGKPEWFRGE